jgi:predicted phosphohydrolase
MTRLWVLSDLHRDVADWTPQVPDADICVVAGDVGEGLTKSLRWLQAHVGTLMPVIFVAGNHEFYRTAVREEWEAARSLHDECPDVHLLENQAIVLGDVRFAGCTLWTDYEIMRSPDNVDPSGDLQHAMGVSARRMNDHKKIALQKQPWKRWRPHEARMAHQRSRRWLEEELAVPHPGPTVVVTHHAPHRSSIPARHLRDAVSAAYASDLSDVIDAGKPDLWIHGHVHDSFDYEVGETRVLSNPKGYGAENPAFNPKLVLDIGYAPTHQGPRL